MLMVLFLSGTSATSMAVVLDWSALPSAMTTSKSARPAPALAKALVSRSAAQRAKSVWTRTNIRMIPTPSFAP